MHRKAVRNTVFLILASIFVVGCSAARRGRADINPGASESLTTYAYTDLTKKNISTNGLFIRKLRLSINIGGTREFYTAHLRKSADGKWLASVQLLSVEVIRIYADRDSVVMLDRIGRKASVMLWEDLSAEYGVTYDLLPLLLGDLPLLARISQKEVNCITATQFRQGARVYNIIADCQVARARSIVLSSESEKRAIEINTEEYDVFENYPYSSVITAKEKAGAFDVKIIVDEILVPWDGEISFSIPKNYKVEKK